MSREGMTLEQKIAELRRLREAAFDKSAEFVEGYHDEAVFDETFYGYPTGNQGGPVFAVPEVEIGRFIAFAANEALGIIDELQGENAKLRQEVATEYVRGREHEQQARKIADYSWKPRCEELERQLGVAGRQTEVVVDAHNALATKIAALEQERDSLREQLKAAEGAIRELRALNVAGHTLEDWHRLTATVERQDAQLRSAEQNRWTTPEVGQ
jgi:hypothetical protein